MKLARSDWLLALLLCVGLELAWAAQDWANLRVLRLPDTDDMMRLQQIRDWLGGQSWFDLTQHRLGLGDGLPMHWTRVNDLIPALIISVVKPFAGVYNAELAAVLLGPAILFFGFLVLSARAALSLDGERAASDVTKIAILIAALAFPATGMFIPGRIDHHALQIVLLLGAVTAALGAPSLRNWALAGMACGLSIVVGLETVPQILALSLAVAGVGLYLSQLRERVGGILFGVGSTLFIARFIFRTISAGAHYHDNFDGIDAFLFTAAILISNMFIRKESNDGSVVLGYMVLFFFVPVAAITAFASAYGYITHGGPHGQVDPFLMRVWMAGYTIVFLRKQEYRSQQTTGLPLSREHGEDAPKQGLSDQRLKYLIIAAPLGMSVLVMLFQLRGAYIGAGLAAPILAIWVSGRRAKGGVALAGAGLLSAGVVHHVVGDKLDALRPQAQPAAPSLSQASLGKSSGAGCTDAATMAALNALPPSRIMAPMDAGAYIIGMTPHHVFAAPYHRNNAGNLAMYRFFMAPPGLAEISARDLNIDYVLFCPDSFS